VSSHAKTIFVSAATRKLDEDHSLASAIRRKKVGENVTLTTLHRGEEKHVKVTLEALPE
jgi:S1-C subfamily serine protease